MSPIRARRDPGKGAGATAKRDSRGGPPQALSRVGFGAGTPPSWKRREPLVEKQIKLLAAGDIFFYWEPQRRERKRVRRAQYGFWASPRHLPFPLGVGEGKALSLLQAPCCVGFVRDKRGVCVCARIFLPQLSRFPVSHPPCDPRCPPPASSRWNRSAEILGATEAASEAHRRHLPWGACFPLRDRCP